MIILHNETISRFTMINNNNNNGDMCCYTRNEYRFKAIKKSKMYHWKIIVGDIFLTFRNWSIWINRLIESS